MRRARPRTGDAAVFGTDDAGVSGGGVSRMQTAAVSGAPEPRRMASRPVDWMADIRCEGGDVDVMVTRREGREKDVEDMPVGLGLLSFSGFGGGNRGPFLFLGRERCEGAGTWDLG